jgi:hypothetical protein
MGRTARVPSHARTLDPQRYSTVSGGRCAEDPVAGADVASGVCERTRSDRTLPEGRSAAFVRRTGSAARHAGVLARHLGLEDASFTSRGATMVRRLSTLVAACCFVAAPASALTITYEAIDRPDVVAGEDLWEIRYRASEFPYGANHGFSIGFDVALFADLEDPPPPVGADWDVITLQPDVHLVSDGLYDALALVDAPALPAYFGLAFVWRGAPGTSPGEQPFTVSEFSPSGVLLGVRESGMTVPVPEPTTAALLLGGLCALARRRR